MTSDYPRISEVVSLTAHWKLHRRRNAENQKVGNPTPPPLMSDISLASQGSPSCYTPCLPRVLTMRSNASRTVGGESNGGSFGNVPFFTDAPSDREDPHLPCHLMPLARNKGFFGRKEILEDLENALLPAKGDGHNRIEPAALKSFAIFGPGGMKSHSFINIIKFCLYPPFRDW
jgi:hypothetical protein